MRFAIRSLAAPWRTALVFATALTLGLSAGKAADYYVDNTGGSDANAGISAGAAWQTLAKVSATTFQAGDRILFKAGGSWTGRVELKGDGSAGSPIVVDQYGTGAKPFINGGGYESAVLLYNVSYWELNNLEIINDGGPTLGFTAGSSTVAASALNRYGVYVLSKANPVRYHIYFRNLYIHNIFPETCTSQTTTDPVTGVTTTTDPEGHGIWMLTSGKLKDTYYDDVLVESCQFSYLYKYGLLISRQQARNPGFEFHKNVVIRGNTFTQTGSSGFQTGYCDGVLVENNVTDDSGSNADPRMFMTHGSGYWPWNCKNVLIQDNQFKNAHGNIDSTGMHVDYGCTNVIVQYNLSYNNEGGFIEILGDTDNIIFRYNVSINDGWRTSSTQTGKLIWLSGYAWTGTAFGNIPPKNCQIYNNTMYVQPGLTNHININAGSVNTSITNNLFIIAGTTIYDNNAGTNPGNFGRNLWYGNRPVGLPASATDILADPQVVNAGGTNAEDYRLKLTSPAIGAGAAVANNGGLDYWGTTLPAGAPCMGATEQIMSQRNLTVTSPYGTPTPNGTTAFGYGALVNASANSPLVTSSGSFLATGYTGTGSAGNGTGATTSFYITSNSTLDWLWQASYAVTASIAAGSGSISPVGTTYVPQGGSQLFSFTAAPGFVVSDVKVNGISVGAVAQYTFTNVSAPQTLAVSFAYSPILIDHTFNEGTNTLNGTPVDGGTLKAANPSMSWVADSGTLIKANGVITAASPATNRAAYIPLGDLMANGNIYELTVSLTRPTSGTWVGAGFFDSATPTVTSHMDLNLAAGTAWFLWRASNDRAEGNIGLKYDVDTGYDVFGSASPYTHTATPVTASSQIFTVRMDLSAANGTNNWGNMTVYQGNSSNGTVIGGLTNVPFNSFQRFRAVGFSTKDADGSISSLKLAQIVPVISIAATTANASEPAALGGTATSGTFTLTRSVLTTGTTTVSLSLSGTAANGMDYAPVANTLTFAPGETTKIVTITPLSDTLVEGSETVVATIGSGTGYTIGSPSSAAVIIADVPPPYEAWISTYTFAPGANKTATGDPDGDSLANLIEYALGLNPSVASANPVTFSQVNVSGSTYLQLSVSRNPAVTNVTIEGISTSTLGDPAAWSTGTTVIVTNTSSVFTVRDNQPIESGTRRFLRLRFTLQP